MSSARGSRELAQRRVGDDGRVLVKCFGGCTAEAIVAAMGLTLADLFSDKGHEPIRVKTSKRVVQYEIRDAAGELRATHERRDSADGTKRFAWRRPNGSSGLNGTAVVDLPLYGIDRLATDAATVVLAEGEKAAESLISRGVPTVASVTGAATAPSPVVLRDLAGKLFDTVAARELRPLLEAGVLGSSFRFSVDREPVDDRPTRSRSNPEGLPERVVLEATVYEFGPVVFPAYRGATAGTSTGGHPPRSKPRFNSRDEWLAWIGRTTRPAMTRDEFLELLTRRA